MKFGCWRAVRLLIATGLVVGTSLAASAQQPTSEQISAIRASCRSDFMAQCTGVKPGTKDALECLKRNAAKVSPSCKAALDAVGPPPTESAAPAPAPAKPAPAPAAAAPPPPAAAAPPPPPATAEPPAAAAEPAAPPPPGPAAATSKRPPSPRVAAVRTACRSDFGVHCAGMKAGSSAALRCLQANAAALSPPCRNAVMATGEGGAPPPAVGAAPPPTLAPLGQFRRCGRARRLRCSLSAAPSSGRCAEMCRPAAAASSNAWRRITRGCRRSVTARSRARRDSSSISIGAGQTDLDPLLSFRWSPRRRGPSCLQ